MLFSLLSTLFFWSVSPHVLAVGRHYLYCSTSSHFSVNLSLREHLFEASPSTLWAVGFQKALEHLHKRNLIS